MCQELVVAADHELRGRIGDVGDVALPTGHRAGLGLEVAVHGLSPPVRVMNRLRLTGTFPATAFSALATDCSSGFWVFAAAGKRTDTKLW